MFCLLICHVLPNSNILSKLKHMLQKGSWREVNRWSQYLGRMEAWKILGAPTNSVRGSKHLMPLRPVSDQNLQGHGGLSK